MNGAAWVVAALLPLLFAYPLYSAWQERRRRRERRAQAAERRWRYEHRGWLTPPYLRGGYVLAGQTPAGDVWELAQDAGGRRFTWHVPACGAPYGLLMLGMPGDERVQTLLHDVDLHPLSEPSLPAPYRLWATHDQLARRLLDTEVVTRLKLWPAPPRAGALHYVVWRPEGLALYGRYDDSWPAVERVVALGVSLAERARWGGARASATSS